MKHNKLIFTLTLVCAVLSSIAIAQDQPDPRKWSNPNGSKTNLTSENKSASVSICTYTWAAQTSGTASQLLTVSAVSDQIGWAAGVGPTVIRTLDGGLTWTSATGTGITYNVFNIYAVDGDTAFCTTSTIDTTFIYKTVNGGVLWTKVFTQAEAGCFIDAIQMISPTEGYAVGDPVGGTWTILKTTDGGDTWARMATEPAQVGTEAGWNNSFLILGTNIWFGTSNTRVYHSTDLGATWSFAATTGTLNTFAVHFNSTGASGLGLAGGSTMVKSIDGGTSYSASGSPGTAGNIDGLEGNETDWWALRSDASVYYSTDQGTTWTTVHTQAGAVFQDIDFVIEGGCAVGWAVGNGGNIAKMNPSNQTETSFYMTIGADDIMYYNGSANGNVSRFGETNNIYRGIEQIYKNVTIPQNAVITSAKLEVKALTSSSGIVVADIYSDLRDNPSAVMPYNQFNTNTNFSTDTLQYPAPPYTAGIFYQIDITDLIQNRVNHTNWNEGDNLGLIIKGNTTFSANAFREITRAENSLTDNKLIITYESSQGCSGDLILTSQAEVDAFNCTEVTGNLTIDDAVAGNITNLMD